MANTNTEDEIAFNEDLLFYGDFSVRDSGSATQPVEPIDLINNDFPGFPAQSSHLSPIPSGISEPDPRGDEGGSTGPDSTIASSLATIVNEFRNAINRQPDVPTPATLIYKIRENKAAAFRRDKDRYDGESAQFIAFRDDVERHLRRNQFANSLPIINGINIFHQYPQIRLSDARQTINFDMDPILIDDDEALFDTLMDSISPKFRDTLGTRPQEAERTNGIKSGRLLWLSITDKISESSGTLKQLIDELEEESLDTFNGNVSDYVTTCKLGIARLRGNNYDYNANNRLAEAIFDTFLAGTDHTVFTNKISQEYNQFNALSPNDQKGYDLFNLLDVAANTFIPLNKKNQWNWKSSHKKVESEQQVITALTAESRNLRANLVKLDAQQVNSTSRRMRRKGVCLITPPLRDCTR